MFCRTFTRSWGLFVVFCLTCVSARAEEPVFPSILDIQRLYAEANGGLANIQAFSSMIASGNIWDSKGRTWEFKLYRKRPNLMRIQVELGGVRQVTIYDGEQAYRMISAGADSTEVVELDGEELRAMEANSQIEGQFFQLRSRPEWLEVVEEVDVMGEAAYEIVIGERADSPYKRLWLSKKHMQEVKLSRMIGAENGELVEELTYFSEYEKVRGVWVAKHIRTEQDGDLVQTIQIDRIRANVGIFDSYFEKPKE